MSKKPEKPKTRKAPAAKRAAPKKVAKAALDEPKRQISEICRLVARWRFLEAEEDYQAAMAAAAPSVTGLARYDAVCKERAG